MLSLYHKKKGKETTPIKFVSRENKKKQKMELAYYRLEDLKKCKITHASNNKILSYQREYYLTNQVANNSGFLYETEEEFKKFRDSVLGTLNKSFNTFLFQHVPSLNLFDRSTPYLFTYEERYIYDTVGPSLLDLAEQFLKQYEIFC